MAHAGQQVTPTAATDRDAWLDREAKRGWAYAYPKLRRYLVAQDDTAQGRFFEYLRRTGRA